MKTSKGTMTSPTKSNKVVWVVIGFLTSIFRISFSLTVYVVDAERFGFAAKATLPIIALLNRTIQLVSRAVPIAGALFMQTIVAYDIPRHSWGFLT